MIRLCFDYGHGGKDTGAIYKGRKESEDNLKVGMAVAKKLRQQGIIVDETRTSDVTLSIKQRSDFENKAKYDYFISFHRNAFKPETANGIETYVYITGNDKSKKLAENLQRALVNIGYKDRGIKTANFHVLKETKSPAILIEIGFIDSSVDNDLFDKKHMEIVNSISKAITGHLGIVYKEEKKTTSDTDPKSGTKMYKIQVGAYSSKNTAELMLVELRKAGFEGYIKYE